MSLSAVKNIKDFTPYEQEGFVCLVVSIPLCVHVSLCSVTAPVSLLYFNIFISYFLIVLG
jgi:hypothetical protein